MAVPATPTNLLVQQGNGNVSLQWDLTATAISYKINRSVDGISYSLIATVSAISYLDTSVTTGILYYYQIAAHNSDGDSSFTAVQIVVPTSSGEMSLGEIRLNAQQRADQVNSQFLTTAEWNANINQSMYELYDLLVTLYEPHFICTPAIFLTNGIQYIFPLPDGQSTSYLNGITNASNYRAPAFYKLFGVDLAVNNASNAWVTVKKFMFEERNQYLYPNSSSTIYGITNMKYRQIGQNGSGTQLEFIPTPSGSQLIRIWYIPRLTKLLLDTDVTTAGISGWIEYVIVDAAIKAMQKEESDCSVLMAQKSALIKRINDSASNIDANQPDRISNVRNNNGWGGGADGLGFNGPIGGF